MSQPSHQGEVGPPGLRVGQIWREKRAGVDDRFLVIVRVAQLPPHNVRIRTVVKDLAGWKTPRGAATRFAQIIRFDGRAGGYELIEDFPK